MTPIYKIFAYANETMHPPIEETFRINVIHQVALVLYIRDISEARQSAVERIENERRSGDK